MPHVPSAVRRPLVVQAAIDLMAEHGVTAVSTRAVAAAAGVPQATLHYLFGTREELLRAVVESVTDQVCGTIRTATAAGTTVNEVLASLVDVLVSGVAEQPARHLLLLELTVHALRQPTLRDLARWQYVRYEQAANEALARVGEQTGTRLRGDTALAVRFVLAVLDGYTLQELADGDQKSARAGLDELQAVLAKAFVPSEGLVRHKSDVEFR